LDTDLTASGIAHVLSVSDAPALADGARCPVTGTFQHVAAEVQRLQLEGYAEPLQATPSHPLFSADRNDWVAAGDVKLGERLQTADGTVRLAARLPALRHAPVFNLEVAERHAFYVHDAGVLAHNGELCRKALGTKTRNGPKFGDLKDHAHRHSDLHPNAYYN